MLKNAGIEVHILRRGAIIQRLLVPDRSGSVADVVLGFDDEQPYKVSELAVPPVVGGGAAAAACSLRPPVPIHPDPVACNQIMLLTCCSVPCIRNFHSLPCCAATKPNLLPACAQDGTSPYMGAVVGRVANRIAHAQFQLDEETYQLAANNGPNCLHGARCGGGCGLAGKWLAGRTPGLQAVGREQRPGAQQMSSSCSHSCRQWCLVHLSSSCRAGGKGVYDNWASPRCTTHFPTSSDSCLAPLLHRWQGGI